MSDLVGNPEDGFFQDAAYIHLEFRVSLSFNISKTDGRDADFVYPGQTYFSLIGLFAKF